MENYKILREVTRKEIFGEEISYTEKQEIVSTLLNGVSGAEDVRRYKKSMRVNPDTDNMYPNYYIPPYNGNKKLRLIQGYMPKTNILYANHYELEIIRLLFLFAPENEKISEMVQNTLNRLKNTCFGNFCEKGECLATGISVLRFLAVTRPNDTDWMDKLINPFGEMFISKGNISPSKSGYASVQNGIPVSYLLMAFTDINNEKTRNFIARKKEWLSELLRRYCLTDKSQMADEKTSDADGRNLTENIIRNALGILDGKCGRIEI